VYQTHRDAVRLLWIGEHRKTRTLLLQRPQNLTAAQDLSLRQRLAYNLRTVRRYLLKEEFQLFGSYSSGVVEGLNAKAKLTTRNADGFKTFKTLELALYHNLGALPERISTHRFF